MALLSLCCIFAHDFMNQSDMFNIKKIKISGIEDNIKNEILKTTGPNCDQNIFKINLFKIEKLIESHPWIESSTVKRNFACELIISIVKEKPLAIVKIKNIADILINNKGMPFKEYNPQKDKIKKLPVITGIDLKKSEYKYMFKGDLFNSVMDFLKTDYSNEIKLIKADKNMGITVETNDIYNKSHSGNKNTIQLKLGFNKYKAKIDKAINISEYIVKYFPKRTITIINLFDINKVFVKTKFNHALHNNLTK